MSASNYFLHSLAAVAASWALTAWLRRTALARGLLDYPNARSSHTQPTPRGGGLSMVITVLIGVAWMALDSALPLRFALAFLVGGAAVAIVGFLDDRGSLSVRTRFLGQCAAAIAALAFLGGLPVLEWGDRALTLGPAGHILALLGILWSLNLFNFMDGIDGIAGSEAVFVAAAGALLAMDVGTLSHVQWTAAIVCASALGFLFWNWPPAKIFMGDVGSGFLGFAIAVCALGAARVQGEMLFVWLILGGVFFVDATTTLVRRAWAREPVYQAHRTHAYQHLAQRWGSHRRATLTVWAVNLLWLLPLASWAKREPNFAPWISLAALAPLLAFAIALGAGKQGTKL